MTADRLSLPGESIKEVNLSAIYLKYLDSYKPITTNNTRQHLLNLTRHFIHIFFNSLKSNLQNDCSFGHGLERPYDTVRRLAMRRVNCPNGTQENSNKAQHISYKLKKTKEK